MALPRPTTTHARSWRAAPVTPIALALVALGVSGCWKLPEEYPELPTSLTVFEPHIPAPEGWLIASVDLPADCPGDRERARIYILYPEAAVGAAAIPAAVLYHSGAFDFVFAPDADDNTAGTHYAIPSRLDRGWAIRHVFATMGMLPNEIPSEIHVGSLAVALAEQNVAVLLPTNCWGDMWHNRPGATANAVDEELGLIRQGRSAAEWTFQYATDPVFAASFGVEFPIGIRPDQVYVIGLGEGGRAVAELLHVDVLSPDSPDDEDTFPESEPDGVPDYDIAGALVDSMPEDLGVYYDELSGAGSIRAGLDRIFLGGVDEIDATSLYEAELPERFAYLYSNADPEVPRELHQRMADRLSGDPDRWLHVDTSPRHVLLNTSDMGPAREAVTYLLTGNKP